MTCSFSVVEDSDHFGENLIRQVWQESPWLTSTLPPPIPSPPGLVKVVFRQLLSSLSSVRHEDPGSMSDESLMAVYVLSSLVGGWWEVGGTGRWLDWIGLNILGSIITDKVQRIGNSHLMALGSAIFSHADFDQHFHIFFG
jgi:hypothetical protein